MNQRFQNAEIRQVSERYAQNELYRAISSIGDQLEFELSKFGLCSEECFVEVNELLVSIAKMGKDFLPSAGDRWLHKYNEYKRIARTGSSISDSELRKVVGIVFGFTVLALGSSSHRFYRYTLAEQLMSVVACHKFEDWVFTLDRIFSVSLPDGWFDAFMSDETETVRDDVRLPAELDTPNARKYFAKAVELGWMTAVNGKCCWMGIGSGEHGKLSQLAYFLGRVYNYKHNVNGNAGENFPERDLISLFGLDPRTRLYSSLTQVYNAQKPQRWRSQIDLIFE